ncbi:MAG: hypothetical protein ACRD2A_06955, partial [Vicinamibacterales bacterium]
MSCVRASPWELSVLLIAWRAWHYTGVFSFLYGTQREHLQIWRPEMSSVEALTAMASSVMMVLTALRSTSTRIARASS